MWECCLLPLLLSIVPICFFFISYRSFCIREFHIGMQMSLAIGNFWLNTPTTHSHKIICFEAKYIVERAMAPMIKVFLCVCVRFARVRRHFMCHFACLSCTQCAQRSVEFSQFLYINDFSVVVAALPSFIKLHINNMRVVIFLVTWRALTSQLPTDCKSTAHRLQLKTQTLTLFFD